MKKINPRYYVYGFCNGELTEEENFETITELNMYLTRHYLESPIIIYGYNITSYFVKGDCVNV